MKILLVDDNAGNRDVLRLMGERRGWRVLEAVDGDDGLEKAKNHHPDMIVSDIRMPGRDGFQFLRNLKRDEKLKSIPCVVFSAIYTDDESRKLALSLGAEAFITKPKRLNELWEEIDAVFKRKKADTEKIEEQLKEDGETFVKNYGKIVNVKLEEKIEELEREIARRSLIEKRLSAQYVLTKIFAEIHSLHEAIPEILKTVCEGFGWEVGELWTLDNITNKLWLESIWHVPSLDISEFEKASNTFSFLPGEGLPGQVLSSGHAAVLVSDVVADSNFHRAIYAKKLGLHGAVAIPLMVKGKINRVLVFFSKQICHLDDEISNTVEDIGRRVGLFIHRRLSEDMLRASEHKYRTLLENLPQKIFQKDGDSTYVSCNDNYARDLRVKADEIVGKTDYDFFPQELADKYRADDRKIMESGQIISIEEKYVQEGQELFVNTVKVPIRDEKGCIYGVIGIFWDITERKQMENQVRKLSLAIEQSPVMVFITDRNGTIEYVNKTFIRVTGYMPEEVLGINPRMLSSGKTPKETYKDMWNVIGTGGSWRGELCNKKKNGELYWESAYIAPINDEEGRITNYVAIKEDITERKKNEERLFFLVEHDPLPMLYNRRYLITQLEHLIAQIKHLKESGSLILLHMDNFKYVNDTMRHPEADRLLTKIATVLKKQIQNTDILARVGGDEFAIILPFVTQEQALVVSKKILLSIKEHCRMDKISGYDITASIGIVQFPEYGDDTNLLLSCADMAMCAAQEKGRNSICVFEHEYKMKIDSRRIWEKRIQKALKEDLFTLYLQPIYDIQQELVCGYEALLRMQGENQEIFMPDDFLPVAERYGLIHEVDRWVIRNAIRLVAAYKLSEKGQFLDINLSGKAFNDKGILSFIQSEISETGIPPQSITFEATETASMENIGDANSFISALKLLGCRFALDDFGSGFSSYYNLKYLPVDYLKIDGSFIRNLDKNHVDQHLVRGMVEMAHGLEKKTIAEYVENEKILQLLKEYGVDYAQGYYIGNPKPVSEVFSIGLADCKER